VTVPVVVLAVGNPSRGDDAIGPQLAARLEAATLPGVEVVVDFQLQIEHALDLEGRSLAVFVDAGAGTAAPYELSEVVATDDFRHTSHALSPGAVLATFARFSGARPPAALLLCVRGETFELGAPLSPAASANLEAAWRRLARICESGAAETGRPAASGGRQA
jgi:hydrogenase maturation protease